MTFFDLSTRMAGELLHQLLAVCLATLACASVGSAPASAQVPCNVPEAERWAAAFRDRVLAYNGLAAFAAAEFGAPVSCEGRVTTEFDGQPYGTLTFGFPDGVSLVVETQPIETSIVTLRAPTGFEAPDRVEEALRAYAEGVGVDIDWSRPERSTEAGATVESFWDPEPGLNASAALITSEGRLVAVRFSMAL